LMFSNFNKKKKKYTSTYNKIVCLQMLVLEYYTLLNGFHSSPRRIQSSKRSIHSPAA